jgi:hypothetical protein
MREWLPELDYALPVPIPGGRLFGYQPWRAGRLLTETLFRKSDEFRGGSYVLLWRRGRCGLSAIFKEAQQLRHFLLIAVDTQVLALWRNRVKEIEELIGTRCAK